MCTYLPIHELNFSIENVVKNNFLCKTHLLPFKRKMAELGKSLVIWDQCCQLALRTKLPDCYTARTEYFLRTEKLLYEIQRQGQNPRAFIQSHIIPHCLDMNTFSQMFERHCQETSLLYVILKLLAYFASFCCLHKSLLLQHVSCKHVQTMP